MTREKITALVESLDEKDRRDVLIDLIDVLYGVGAPEDMGADQISAVTSVLDEYGLVPEES